MPDLNKIGSNRVPNAGKGRPKGAANKATKALKEMILGALDQAGGESYLLNQANENPTAFLTLIGKVLPMAISAEVKATVTKIERVIVDPSN
jgi:hypothetical protein